jgi:hypothetical protein
VEGMDMSEVEGMNMLEEHNHLSNHQLGEESMNMSGIHMVEVEGMHMVQEHLSNHRSEKEGMDIVEEQSSKERLEVEGMDMQDIDMVEDMTAEVEVEGEHEGVVLARHWIGDGVERHRRTHWEWEEFSKLGCSEGHTTFASPDFNCLTLGRVEKSEEKSENGMKYVWNELKLWAVFIG